MRTTEFEHGNIEALIDTGIIISGCLSIIDMAVYTLHDVDGCHDVRGSLQHCRLMLQLLLPDDEPASDDGSDDDTGSGCQCSGCRND